MSSEALRRKLGKIFMFGFQGSEPPETLGRFFDQWGLSGVIVFTRNASSGAAMRTLIEHVRARAARPILVAIDHEGGPVLRLSSGVSQLPSAMGLAATGDPANARLAGRIAGLELSALGVDINLAPVLDVNSNPDNPGIGLRSFGETAEAVARFALPYLEGLQSAGVSGTAKHFPGKGSASLDAHFDLPLISRKEPELRRQDFPPFIEAVRADIDCFMGSHTVYQAFGDDVPGTLSRRVMTGLLREEMGFRGVLITDDLEMGAIRDHFGFERAIKSSFLAGADLLLICHDAAKQQAALELMERAVETGEIPEARVDESVARVERLLAKHVSRKTSEPLEALVARHDAPVRRLWAESVCLVRDPGALLPLTAFASAAAFFPVLAELSPVEESSGSDPALAATLAARLPALGTMSFAPKRTADLTRARQLASESEVSIFFSYNAHVDPEQAALLAAVRDASRRLVLVALRNPYDLRLARPGDTALATLGFRPGVLAVAAGVLLGELSVTGRLPAAIG
ncbi:MAG: beta-N-acetylhexosaminidase [Candidatus Wallbacteria bacterium]|nr:beta-N-acetylhexosaminidase [Candidatus Wallbacteria bacterium]